MFFDEHKKAITTMMGKRSAKGERTSDPTPMKPEIVKEEDGEVDGRHVAAQDIMAALNEKSAAKLMESLSNFFDLHSSSPKESDESDME